MNDFPVSGLLLTGGASRRMGADKAGQLVGGKTMGALGGRALLEVADPVLALGADPGLGLEPANDPGRGPLAALAAGLRHLADRGLNQPVLLVACDLPFVTPKLLRLVADFLGGAQAAVPVAEGRRQPLAACYSPAVLPLAERMVARGVLSMRALLSGIDVNEVPEAAWRRVAGPRALNDVDTPADLVLANWHAERSR